MDDIKAHISQLRRDFASHTLDEKNISHDPYELFAQWMKEALDSKVIEPNAMVLSTVGNDGMPGSRIVLLRDFSVEGFVFFTNYNSQKGRELAGTSKAALLFFWADLERQVRVAGTVRKVSEKVSDDYFKSRPRESQIGAWASEQSSAIADRSVLEERVKQLEEEYKNKDVPRPPHWGGYIISAERIEFWQGRPSRLHDRIRFSLNEGKWRTVRLAP
jgi:pyridoxamine 5'-phosphate oxidase